MNIKSRLNVITGDVLGGLNAAIITLPQALAFGVATGFGASAGIWGAIILCLIAGVLGTKVPMISGVTGPVAIVVASVMHALNKDMGSVIFIIFMAGIFQILLSLSLSCNFRFYEWCRRNYYNNAIKSIIRSASLFKYN